MTTLTNDQIRQLNMYSTYITPPKHPLFTHEQLQQVDVLPVVKTITGIENTVVAASYLMRRYGMFVSTQLVMLTTYNELWMGHKNEIQFGAITEYGNQSISMYIDKHQYRDVTDQPRDAMIRYVLHEQIHPMIVEMRKHSNISPLTLWENVFGFLLWHFYVMLGNSATMDKARIDFNLLKTDELWNGIAPKSLFGVYLKGCEPSQLINTMVRTTCCFSKDVPGLQACGFCPLG
ncbi:MAG: hypothetical protein ACE3JQ_01190 [Paenisporosarcina sp.]